MSSKKFHFLFLRNIIAYSFNNKVGKEEKYISPLSETFKMAPWTLVLVTDRNVKART
jgi:hypothetical protein